MTTISERATQNLKPKEMSEPDKRLHLSEMIRVAELDWIRAQAEADIMEEKKSIFLAEAKLNMRAQGHASSATQAEDLVRASENYKAFIASMIDARRKANELRAEWRALERSYWTINSLEAHERAQMRMSR